MSVFGPFSLAFFFFLVGGGWNGVEYETSWFLILSRLVLNILAKLYYIRDIKGQLCWQVHGAFAGFSGITVGLCNTHYAYFPIPEVIKYPRLLDPNSRMWHRCLTSTGQPDFIWSIQFIYMCVQSFHISGDTKLLTYWRWNNFWCEYSLQENKTDFHTPSVMFPMYSFFTPIFSRWWNKSVEPHWPIWIGSLDCTCTLQILVIHNRNWS